MSVMTMTNHYDALKFETSLAKVTELILCY